MNGLPDKIYCCSLPHSTGKEQAQIALRAGRVPRNIFIEGQGAENFSACIAAIRGRGTLGLVGGARVLGEARKTIMDRMRLLKARGITPYDFVTGETDPAELLNTAMVKILAFRNLGADPQAAKKRGKRGGTMKGVRAREHRDSLMPDEIVQRLWRCHKLTGEDVANILGKPWSETSLHRQYGPRFRNKS